MSIIPTRILLATDGSKETAALAGKTKSEPHVVYVHHPPQVPYAYDERYPEQEAPGRTDAPRSAQQAGFRT